MAAPTYSVADYTAAIQALLPRGRVWPRDPNATLIKVAAALAAIYVRTNARANALITDAFPATSVELLTEWEATLGLPGWYGSQASTTAARQARVIATLTDTGGQSIAFFVGLLATLGWTVTINQFKRYTVRDNVVTPIWDDAWAHAWQVVTAGPPNALLETVVRRFAPAHTIVTFLYT
jgi:uncharacterized protein YmfQ (DUF2313 family)